MTDNQSTPLKTNYLWYFYPFLLLILGYINRSIALGELKVLLIDKLFASLGSAFIFLIIPLIIFWIWKISTKKKLSFKNTLILFYGISVLIFIITTVGQIQQMSH